MLFELMIDEPSGFHYLVQMSGIRHTQAPGEVCDIDCLISTERCDSESVLPRFMHFTGWPMDQYLENKVSLPYQLALRIELPRKCFWTTQGHTKSLTHTMIWSEKKTVLYILSQTGQRNKNPNITPEKEGIS